MGDNYQIAMLKLTIRELQDEVAQLRDTLSRYQQAVPVLIGEDPLTADLSEISHETLITTMEFND